MCVSGMLAAKVSPVSHPHSPPHICCEFKTILNFTNGYIKFPVACLFLNNLIIYSIVIRNFPIGGFTLYNDSI